MSPALKVDDYAKRLFLGQVEGAKKHVLTNSSGNITNGSQYEAWETPDGKFYIRDRISFLGGGGSDEPGVAFHVYTPGEGWQTWDWQTGETRPMSGGVIWVEDDKLNELSGYNPPTTTPPPTTDPYYEQYREEMERMREEAARQEALRREQEEMIARQSEVLRLQREGAAAQQAELRRQLEETLLRYQQEATSQQEGLRRQQEEELARQRDEMAARRDETEAARIAEEEGRQGRIADRRDALEQSGLWDVVEQLYGSNQSDLNNYLDTGVFTRSDSLADWAGSNLIPLSQDLQNQYAKGLSEIQQAAAAQGLGEASWLRGVEGALRQQQRALADSYGTAYDPYKLQSILSGSPDFIRDYKYEPPQKISDFGKGLAGFTMLDPTLSKMVPGGIDETTTPWLKTDYLKKDPWKELFGGTPETSVYYPAQGFLRGILGS